MVVKQKPYKISTCQNQYFEMGLEVGLHSISIRIYMYHISIYD